MNIKTLEKKLLKMAHLEKVMRIEKRRWLVEMNT